MINTGEYSDHIYGDWLWNPEAVVNSWQKVHSTKSKYSSNNTNHNKSGGNMNTTSGKTHTTSGKFNKKHEQTNNKLTTFDVINKEINNDISDNVADNWDRVSDDWNIKDGSNLKKPKIELYKESDPDLAFGEVKEDEFDIEKKMMEDHTYPSPTQDNFQEAIYTKREFYINEIPYRGILTEYEDMKEYRDNKCSRDFKLTESQTLLSNFINPNTPYKGVLIYWGTGAGKGGATIAIAEKFKPMVEKYGTRIHVLVPGPLNKQNFLEEILKSTGETYRMTYHDKTMVIDEAEENKIRKNAINIINQYYRLISYRSFYKKVLGEKIREKIITGDKVKISSRKTEAGEYERDISVDRIYNLDNTLLVVDEAHNLTGNEYGDAVKKIIEKSKNLKVVLLSATPMKNAADDIFELLNYLRPASSPIERDKVFTGLRGHQMSFKPNGKDYFRKMCRGYVSYLRGADPLTFAERIDMGVIPPGLDFTKVTRCYMLPFQLATYNRVIATMDDSLDRNSGAIANFVFPGLSKDKTDKNLYGYYGIEGINEMRIQLKNNGDAICHKLASTLLAEYDIKDPLSLIYTTDNNKTISGDIFTEKYLKHFSIKFHTVLVKINETIHEKRGSGLIFVYSNLVRVGIEVFQEVLQKNGYIEFQENSSSYNLRSDTRCYYCSTPYGKHSHLPDSVPKHDFHPATFISITGKSDENADQIPEEKHRILRNVFNNTDNKNGKYIKIILGSKAMSEGITLKNIKEIHILDVHYNLGRVDQVMGRGIRFCKHYDITDEENPYPKVEIYKYAIALDAGLSREEILYKNAEHKYRLIKEIERVLQEEAIDCPLNINGNIFPEELQKYGNCGSKDNPCPAICGYMPCAYKCSDKSLNAKYYDPERKIYRKVKKSELDYSTYTNVFADEEIEYAKTKIKEMYRLAHLYNLSEILKYVKKSYPVSKREMFDDYYVYKALSDLLPITNNDFNNFRDTIVDKFNVQGYLIYRHNFYLFQPFDKNEDLPMYYRRNFQASIINKLSLKDYINNLPEYKSYKEQHQTDEDMDDPIALFVRKNYEIDDNYYSSREEYKYVGSIDLESNRKKVRKPDEITDNFKIRTKLNETLTKKRGTGIPSFKGAVCKTSKDKQLLLKIAKDIKADTSKINIRTEICSLIEQRLYDLEKYSTNADNNKYTYLMIPTNHPDPRYTFPLNLEDRINYLIDLIQRETRTSANPIIISTPISGQYKDIKYVMYEIEFDKSMDDFEDIMNLYGINKKKNKWTVTID